MVFGLRSTAGFRRFLATFLFSLLAAQAQAVTNVGGSISVDTTWPASAGPYLLNSGVSVDAGVTLTIEPGAVIKGNGGTNGLYVFGTLRAQGTAGAPIIFTSYQDDSVGGDTNGDGNATTPGPSGWAGLQFLASSSGNVLDHVVVRYAGYSGAGVLIQTSGLTLQNSTISDSGTGVQITDASPTLSANVIERNSSIGISINGSNPPTAPTLTNNIIRNNGGGVDIYNASPVLTANTVQNNSSFGMRVMPSSTPALSGNSFSGNGSNGIIWFSHVGVNTIWTASGGPYVLNGAVGVEPGVTLTIEPGTVIKGNGDAYLYVSGTLRAQGSASQPIIFTSYQDDSVGGDSNNDGNATTPVPGQWRGLFFVANSSGNLLDHNVIRYAGLTTGVAVSINTSSLTLQNSTISDSGTGVQITDASPTLSANVIERNSSIGISINGSNPPTAPTLTNNIIRNNGGGVDIYNASPVLTANTVQNNSSFGMRVMPSSTPALSGNSFSGNGSNGIIWFSHVGVNTIWTASGGPYVLNGAVGVEPGVTLTIEPGTVIKGNGDAYLYVSGTLRAQGSASQPIIFTSYQDDSVGGDSNNDGNATTPVPGQWRGLFFVANSSGNLLDHNVIRYAGLTTGVAVSINTSSLTLQNSTISDSGTGLYINGVSPTIRRNTIRNNNMGATGTGNLANNYWGSSSGPYDGSDDRATGGDYNPNGTGNGVSDGIIYRPFIGGDTTPFSCSTSTGTLAGKVIDRTTGLAKAGAMVTLVGAASTISGAGGYFSFGSIPAGSYRLTAALMGYFLGSHAVNVCGTTTAYVDLTRASTANGPNSAAHNSADPVNTATGNYFFSRIDLKLPGKGLPFTFERTYNAQEAATGATGPLGFGWTHQFNAGWSIDGDGNVTLRWGDGRTETYAPDGVGGFTPQYGVFDTLATAAGGAYTLTIDPAQ